MENPFKNDPFALVWKAFKNLFKDKECEIWFDQHQGDEDEGSYGLTIFHDDGSDPSVFIYAEQSVNNAIETFAHELAHVAVGIANGHNEVWEAAFDSIFGEYNRIGDELFGSAENFENGAKMDLEEEK